MYQRKPRDSHGAAGINSINSVTPVHSHAESGHAPDKLGPRTRRRERQHEACHDTMPESTALGVHFVGHLDPTFTPPPSSMNHGAPGGSKGQVLIRSADARTSHQPELLPETKTAEVTTTTRQASSPVELAWMVCSFLNISLGDFNPNFNFRAAGEASKPREL